MKKIIGMSMLLLVSLVLVGCGNKNTTTTTETTTVETDEWTTAETTTTEVTTENNTEQDAPDVDVVIWVESCDRYLGFLQCMMDKMPIGAEMYAEELNNLKLEWTAEEDKASLAQGCQMIIDMMAWQTQGMEELWCSL